MKNFLFFVLSVFLLSTPVAKATTIEGNFTVFQTYDHGYVRDHSYIQFDGGTEVQPEADNIFDNITAKEINFREDVDTDPSTNSVKIEGLTIADGDIISGNTYVIGHLSFKNGDWYGVGFPTAWATFNMKSRSSITEYDSAEFSETITFLPTPDNPDPYLDADLLYFVDHPEYGSFRIYEDQIGVIEILGVFGSLNPAGFGKVLTPDTAYWNSSITQAPAVPEPATILLFSFGLLSIAGISRRKK